ncbi:PucR family transcriptional regulator [Reinekea marinisedimentorum]|uniref:PucR-like helix-turn-helix protein n=1 Tax=Reinekea marinisedimentorum TaxID=230495 RepID=A0A4V2UIJ2_9GAMM|nr:PucR family transcriptional regulator [Reinekea marinisedimentorum]TCS36390.1 PucR-like helix-turn-helix protein [Reinekea marinisedimentorum]
MSICVADVPNIPGLESIRFRAGFQGASAQIRWPYVAENESISPWIMGGELIFVTGINHTRDEKNLIQLIEEGYRAQVSGFVILTGHEFIKKIPASVLKKANDLSIPILEQPYNLKMVLVTEILSNTLVQDRLMGQSLRLFLSRLVNSFTEAPELVELRARELGIHADESMVSVCLRSRVATQMADNKWLAERLRIEHWLESRLPDRGVNLPILNEGQDWLIFWPAIHGQFPEMIADLEALLESLTKQFPQCTFQVGVSNSFHHLSKISEAAEQARKALSLTQLYQNEPICRYDQIGIAQLFSQISNRKLLLEFCQDQLQSLCFCESSQSLELKRTLRCYLDYSGSSKKAAEHIGIHRNTLSQRIKKLEQLLDKDLNNPLQRLNLQNALIIECILIPAKSTDTAHKEC